MAVKTPTETQTQKDRLNKLAYAARKSYHEAYYEENKETIKEKVSQRFHNQTKEQREHHNWLRREDRRKAKNWWKSPEEMA